MKPFALALSGGGLLGAAHLGALRFLEEQGVKATAVAGTSAGGLVASLYALGIPMHRLIRVGQEIANHPLEYFHLNTVGLLHELLPKLGPPATGLIQPERFVATLLSLAPSAETTADWNIPTVLTAVDLVTLTAVAFTNRPLTPPARGAWQIATDQPLWLAMQATMAMPGLFAAPRHKDHVLVDGGVADTLPVDWAYALDPEFIVAIDVATPAHIEANRLGLGDVLGRSESYATDTLSRLREGRISHLTVRPDTLNVPFLGFADYGRLVESGWQAMKETWPQIADL
ncbi:MAG: patatin-like phospholipase family protein [Firmicutes bacterium]|nr:patatin-like phospholipase family protein [Bacillota bacterium]